MSGPLPLAPRPHDDEALSSWVLRLAARYDLAAGDFIRYLLGGRRIAPGPLGRLDYLADAKVEAALAAAARIDVARIRRLRIAGDDGRSVSWYRASPARCPACMREDLAERGEVYLRATWRLGCHAVCPVHGILLCDTCCRCGENSRCGFRCVDGRLRLACLVCQRVVDPETPEICRNAQLNDTRSGVFGVSVTPRLVRLVGELQGDVHAALAGLRPWRHQRSARSLATMVRDLAASLIRAVGIKVEPPFEAFEVLDRWGEGTLAAVEPASLAILAPRGAYEVLAIVAAVLDRPGTRTRPECVWRPIGQGGPVTKIDMVSLVGSLPPRERERLRAKAAAWEAGAGAHSQRCLAALEAALRSDAEAPLERGRLGRQVGQRPSRDTTVAFGSGFA